MTTRNPAVGGATRNPLLVVALCFSAILLDGYDLLVYGAMVPALLKYEPWGLSPTEVGLIGSYTTLGMLIGALTVGAVTDVVGRRRVVLGSIAWFSLAMVAAATASSAGTFGLFRFLAGIGLGGVMPTVIALTVEYAPRGRRQLYNAVMFVGYAFGGVLAALAALLLLADHGFRILLWIGAVPALVLLPLMWRFLPESVSYLERTGRADQARELARVYGVERDDPAADAPAAAPSRTAALRHLVAPGRRGPLVLFSVSSFCGLLLVYGLNTWLPQIMRSAGYPLGSSISFLLVLNLGAILGTAGAAALADRIGAKIAISIAFLAAATTLVALSLQPPAALLYLFVAVAGLGSIGTQILVNGFAAEYFPAWARGTAVGITLGVGRIGAVVAPTLVGVIIDAGLDFRWNFYVFVLPALVGMVAILFVPKVLAAQQTTSERISA